jgi:hypothetical protein
MNEAEVRMLQYRRGAQPTKANKDATHSSRNLSTGSPGPLELARIRVQKLNGASLV